MNQKQNKVATFNKLNLTLSNIKLNEYLLNSCKVCHVSWWWDWQNVTLEQPNWSSCEIISRANGIISKCRYYIPTETLTSIYYSLFQSFINMVQELGAYISKNTIKGFIL